MLYHVGYERRSADALVERLRLASVDELVDVRLTPISRKPGLSKTKLSAALATAGIAYRHDRLLGNPRENRESYYSGNAAAGIAAYEARLANGSAVALDRLLGDAEDRSVAVLCVERDELRCHRQVLTRHARDRGIIVVGL